MLFVGGASTWITQASPHQFFLVSGSGSAAAFPPWRLCWGYDLVRRAHSERTPWTGGRRRCNGRGIFPSNCQTFSGRCTGFGSRRCVTAPAALTPDSIVVEQCCGGWFQYPWITVCVGQQPTQG